MTGGTHASNRCNAVLNGPWYSPSSRGGVRGNLHEQVHGSKGLRVAVQRAGSRRTSYRFLLLAGVFVGCFTLVTMRPLLAEWDGVKTANSAWYEAQEINPEAKARLGVAWKSCCNHSDVVKTRFRVNRDNADDEWWYLDGNTWRKVPADIIHWNDSTPDGQPVMFAYNGTPTCFYPGETGG